MPCRRWTTSACCGTAPESASASAAAPASASASAPAQLLLPRTQPASRPDQPLRLAGARSLSCSPSPPPSLCSPPCGAPQGHCRRVKPLFPTALPATHAEKKKPARPARRARSRCRWAGRQAGRQRGQGGKQPVTTRVPRAPGLTFRSDDQPVCTMAARSRSPFIPWRAPRRVPRGRTGWESSDVCDLVDINGWERLLMMIRMARCLDQPRCEGCGSTLALIIRRQTTP